MNDIKGRSAKLTEGTSLVSESLKFVKIFKVLPEGSTSISQSLVDEAIERTMNELPIDLMDITMQNAHQTVTFHNGNIQVALTINLKKYSVCKP